MRVVWSLLVCSLLIPALAGLDARAAEPEPRATMQQIFEAIAQLLSASLDEERFADPSRREAMLRWMDLLVAASDRLERHGASRDPGFEYLARSLVSDVRQIRRRYSRGRYEDARFFVGHLTETCVACHSRLPDPDDFALSGRLLDSVDPDTLAPTARTRLLVATRQFEHALLALEELFADPAVRPATLDLDGHFVDYLTISIRVKRDLARARPVLERVRARSDAPHYLQRNLESWARSLAELESETDGAPDIARARELIARSRGLSEFPADREGLVYDLMASSVLHRYLDSVRGPDARIAEAYYLLGATAAATRRSYWVSEAEFFLESAIRTAPGSPFAERAYALLEEYTVIGYSGSSGVHIPPDVQRTLDELRRLIDAER